MLTQEQVPAVINNVRERLDAAARKGDVHLKVLESDSRLEDDWLYVLVVPEDVQIRASEHANLMAKVEKALREDGIENVLLVPMIDE